MLRRNSGMGVFSFQFPEDLNPSFQKELESSFMSGGPDTMPFYSTAKISNTLMTVSRDEPESGFLNAPWVIPGHGNFITTSSTLSLKDQPYSLLTELARGKINQVRSYLADWEMGGLSIPESLRQLILNASHQFGKCFSNSDQKSRNTSAETSLGLAYAAADQLMREYMRQIFALRHSENQPIEAGITGRVTSPLPESAKKPYESAFNHAQAGFNWKTIEPSQGVFSWEESDRIVDSCQSIGMETIGGPVIHGSELSIPDWVVHSNLNANQIATAMIRFLETVIRRYETKIHRWIVCSGLNGATFLDLNDETLFRITAKLAETAKQINSSFEVIVGIGHPWGGYLARERREFSPFTFADNICRAGLNLAAIDLELVMGSSNNSSYCRDLLETSRILDLYSLLGMPMTVTIGYPATPSDGIKRGYWRTPPSDISQADWTESYASLILSKRYIQSIQWAEFQDTPGAIFPNCGLVTDNGQGRTTLNKIKEIRAKHLR